MSRKTRRRKSRSSRHKRSRHRRRTHRHHRRRIRRKTRHKRHRRRHKRMQGGMRKLGFSAFPPGGPYNPSSNMNGLDGGYYYAKNNLTVEPPRNISASSVGGGKRRKRRKSRKSRKSRKRRKSRRRRRRSLRGGGLLSNTVVEAVPMGTDLRDAYWAGTNGAVNLWNTWNGQPNNMTGSVADQPIGDLSSKGGSPLRNVPDIGGIIKNASETVAKGYQ